MNLEMGYVFALVNAALGTTQCTWIQAMRADNQPLIDRRRRRFTVPQVFRDEGRVRRGSALMEEGAQREDAEHTYVASTSEVSTWPCHGRRVVWPGDPLYTPPVFPTDPLTRH